MVSTCWFQQRYEALVQDYNNLSEEVVRLESNLEYLEDQLAKAESK
jgi:cell division protein FtsB